MDANWLQSCTLVFLNYPRGTWVWPTRVLKGISDCSASWSVGLSTGRGPSASQQHPGICSATAVCNWNCRWVEMTPISHWSSQLLEGKPRAAARWGERRKRLLSQDLKSVLFYSSINQKVKVSRGFEKMIHKTQQDYSLFSLGVFNLPLGSVTDLLLFLYDASGKYPVIKAFHLILLMLFVVLTACGCYFKSKHSLWTVSWLAQGTQDGSAFQVTLLSSWYLRTQQHLWSLWISFGPVVASHPGIHCSHTLSVGEHAAPSRRLRRLHWVHRTTVSVLNFPSSHRIHTPTPHVWKRAARKKDKLRRKRSYIWEQLFPWATSRTCNTRTIRVEEHCLTAELRFPWHSANLRVELLVSYLNTILKFV